MPESSEAARRPAVCDAALARAFELLGKRWNGVILGTLIQGVAGFADLGRAVDGISDSMLSDRLAELARGGLVRRTVDEGPPVAVTYGLTEAGHAILPALEALTVWAGTSLPARDCPGTATGTGTRPA